MTDTDPHRKDIFMTRASSRRAARISSFTLIEMLVVMAIISTLASMLLPALATSREKGRQTATLNNLRQIGLGLELYTGDYGGFYPTTAAAPDRELPERAEILKLTAAGTFDSHNYDDCLGSNLLWRGGNVNSVSGLGWLIKLNYVAEREVFYVTDSRLTPKSDFSWRNWEVPGSTSAYDNSVRSCIFYRSLQWGSRIVEDPKNAGTFIEDPTLFLPRLIGKTRPQKDREAIRVFLHKESGGSLFPYGQSASPNQVDGHPNWTAALREDCSAIGVPDPNDIIVFTGSDPDSTGEVIDNLDALAAPR